MHDAIDRANDMAKTWAAFAQLTADTQVVMAMRIMGLSGAWHVPDDENTEMVAEKMPAFTEAIVSGALTAWAGRGPDRVMKAVLDPISEKASANRERLVDHGPRLFGQPKDPMIFFESETPK